MLQSSRFWIAALTGLLRNRRHFIRQTGQSDCGVACALTLLNLLGRPADPVSAVEDLDADRDGSSLEELRRFFADRQGMPAQALAAPADHLHELTGHAILHMDQQHYVLLLGQGKPGVLVFDPAMGPVFYPRADFAALYSGHALQVDRAPGAAATLRPRRRREAAPPALFVTGIAGRLLECALLLCVVAVLFLVLNQSSFASLLGAFGLIAACGGLLLLARQVRFEGEDALARARQGRLWRGLMRTVLHGRDLNGFRGSRERDVAGALKRGLGVTVPTRAQLPAALGGFVVMPALLCLLHPAVAVLHLALLGAALAAAQIDTVQVCRRSVRPGIGRYTPLKQGHAWLGFLGSHEILGEFAKWAVIGFAGFAVLLSALPPVALMFWILAAMQLVPLDFRRAAQLAPALGQRDPVSALTGAEVPLRRQRLVGPVDLSVTRKDGLIRIEGIRPLTRSLEQPDLTVREQRLIMADVVRHTLENLPGGEGAGMGAGSGTGTGTVRVFGPGQEASRADYEQLLLARESAPGQTLPMPADTIEAGLTDPVLRNLQSCAPDDLPVFWDFRGRLRPSDLRARLGAAGMARAAHLNMTVLTLVEAGR
ncbi:C39 family peptidase [Pukyongiella litopenaei]|uniref:Peptidase C39 domain-containing protein n=1 Tax=Pukyongiella litopenaei TaxID=2605946 RepID=A0A2S0MTW9_9RHOB|nr:cysteine peptidase family C39 domain-containing protein [Pukyongiella litopenaei]AVO39325.1 hypothetical protein C6Y53_17565 [Pukyongiella litopenaei]